MEYNEEHGIEPKTVFKTRDQILSSTSVADVRKKDIADPQYEISMVAEPVIKYMSATEKEDLVEQLTIEMKNAAKDLEFEKAAMLRDEIDRLKKKIH